VSFYYTRTFSVFGQEGHTPIFSTRSCNLTSPQREKFAGASSRRAPDPTRPDPCPSRRSSPRTIPIRRPALLGVPRRSSRARAQGTTQKISCDLSCGRRPRRPGTETAHDPRALCLFLPFRFPGEPGALVSCPLLLRSSARGCVALRRRATGHWIFRFEAGVFRFRGSQRPSLEKKNCQHRASLATYLREFLNFRNGMCMWWAGHRRRRPAPADDCWCSHRAMLFTFFSGRRATTTPYPTTTATSSEKKRLHVLPLPSPFFIIHVKVRE
jgi:hypothetical protein